nr:MAG TPA: Restriction endonuclease [Bacteriophage sp.]
MNWLYITSGAAVIFLIIGYICGNKVGHKQELDSKEINSARLSSEIQQKEQSIQQLNDSIEKYQKLERSAENNLSLETQRLLKDREDQLSDLVRALDSREKKLDSREKELEHAKTELCDMLTTAQITTPFLAKQFSDFMYVNDLLDADYLETKSRPAFTAAEKVREIAKQKRVLQEQCKLQEYQLNLYETAFPWLAEFKEISSEDLQQLASVDTAPDSEYSSLKKWLSPQEYQSLPSAERLQLALERYTKRQKTNWQIGIEYERYVGYCYERKGYKVRYFGATEGLEDMGRDLIVTQGKKLFVIQCKRWSTEKTIHEKHIFQLYGTTILQMLENPDKRVSGLFITTTTLSELAKSCADYLHITVVENYPLREYPLIKCNISKNGEKIYHLPFDQQYDRVMVEPDDGDCYASTVQEAESKGFRHAWRWHSS